MKQSSNLKKSLSHRDVHRLDPRDAPLKALRASSSSKKSNGGQGSVILSRTACFHEDEESAAVGDFIELERAVDQAQVYGNNSQQEMAQQDNNIFPVNVGRFNSISSIASEGLNNFTSVQSIQTKSMMQNLGHAYSEAEAIVTRSCAFKVCTGRSNLDNLLQKTVIDEMNRGGNAISLCE